MMEHKIAIVGMACRYPDARSPVELWENVLAQRRAFRKIPAERLRLEDYYSPDRQAPDRIYIEQAAVITNYEFDRVRFRVAGSTFRSADLTHWLALDVAAQALADAGFPEGEGLPKTSTGIVLGNTLTGEFSRANLMRLRWPYVRRVIDAALIDQGWSPEQRQSFVQELEVRYKAPFPPVGAESLAGGLANTIAGRICNYFDLKGGGYTVDGACSSSLLAVTNACSALVAGDLDLALAGGVDLSLDPFELVGFSKTSALAPHRMRVFDARSAGFWPGEGCGLVVLMRHADAVAQGRRVYALIRGWGMSSDGSGGITRPAVEGQMLAVKRAYQRAGYGVESVPYFEGHGTGTAVGDATELGMLTRVRREAAPDSPPAVIGSVKGNIGHTKAAAGTAGLIKATMALYSQVLPPNTGTEEPHPLLTDDTPALRILREGQCWSDDAPLRAGLSAMGFGGINTHIALEGSPSRARKRALDWREKMLLASAQDAELFLLSAPDTDGMQRQVEELLAFADKLSLAELGDLAARLQQTVTRDRSRAALVASTPEALAKGLETLRGWLDEGVTDRSDFRSGVFIGSGSKVPRIGFLFPGQGTRIYRDGGALGRRFDFIPELYEEAAWLKNGHEGVATAVAQPAIVTAGLAALRVLNRLGIRAQVGVGHSLGEITALHWAGALSEEAVLRVAAARGHAMMDLGDPTGTMASIRADHEAVEGVLQEGDKKDGAVTIACMNTPSQTVISGQAAAVAAVIERAQGRGLKGREIAVSHAFHSPLVAAAVEPLAAHLAEETFHPLQRAIVSTITGAPLAPDEDLPALLCRQVTDPVRFTEAIAQADEGVDLFIEVGPGQVMQGLAAECVDTPIVSLDACGPSLRGLLQATGAAFALGAFINQEVLFGDRFTRPFDLNWKPGFFVNPCELAPVPEGAEAIDFSALPAAAEITTTAAEPSQPELEATDGAQESIPDLVRRLVAQRAELPISAVNDDDRMLSDLHLNSITVSQLVAEAARQLDVAVPVAPTEFADATVAAIAQTLEEIVQNGGGAGGKDEELPPGIDSWIRSYSVEWVARPLADGQAPTEPGSWQVNVPADHPLADGLQRAFAQAAGDGVVVCLPAEADERHLGLLLEGAQAALATTAPTRFVLVQHDGGGAALARTLHLEAPEVTTCVVDVPAEHPEAVTWVVAEALAATGYVEVRYDGSGQRWEPVLSLLPLSQEPGELPLGPEDVLLVTGGGKGITAECALSLARETGVRLALMGRSQPEGNPELTANLERMRAAGVQFRYVAADVTNLEAVQAAVREVEEALGPVTGILHGAARNVPKLLRAQDEETFRRTLAPKVEGARKLLAAINPDQLKLFVAFGSIIARTGLPGEADYGLANEWLARLTERLQSEHPACRCLTIDWTVWAGAGMGERLGTLETLARQGIAAIPLEEGVAMLHRLLAQEALPPSVVVCGRNGDLPTVEVQRPELPFWRFIEQARVYYPGAELIADVALSRDTDPYVDEHIFQGERLFPAVMGLEAMAQVAMSLAESDQVPVFEGVQLQRPVVVPQDKATTIRLAALVREPGQIEVALRSQETGFQIDHFRATCRFDVQGMDSDSPSVDLEAFPPLVLDPHEELYGGLFFQAGRFQRVGGYRQVAAHSTLAELTRGNGAAWFSRFLPPDLVLGDPGARDALMHAIQVCVPVGTLLPVGVERIVPGLAQAEGPCYVWARERTSNGNGNGGTLAYDVVLTDAEGHPLEQWQGLQLKLMGGTAFDGPWSAPVLGAYLERRLEELLPAGAVTVAIERDPDGDRRARSNRAIQRALGEAVAVQRRPDGKPEGTNGRVVSAAHAADLTLAVAGAEKGGPIGCDVEPVTARTAAVWGDLLGVERFKLAHVIAQAADEDQERAATRVWAASECLTKAGAAVNAPLTLAATKADGWVLIAAGSLTVATLVTQVQTSPEPLALAVLRRNDNGSDV